MTVIFKSFGVDTTGIPIIPIRDENYLGEVTLKALRMCIDDGKTVGLGSESEQEPAGEDEDEDDDLEERVAATVQEVIKAVEQEAKGAAEEVNEVDEAQVDSERTEEEIVETSVDTKAEAKEKSTVSKRKRKTLDENVPRRVSQRNLGKARRQVQPQKGPIDVDSDEEESHPVPLAFKATLTSAAKKQKQRVSSEESHEQATPGRSVNPKGTLWVGPTVGGGFAGFHTTPVEQQLTMLVKQVQLLQEMVQELQTSNRVLMDHLETVATTQATQHQETLDKLDALTTEVVEEEVPLDSATVTATPSSL